MSEGVEEENLAPPAALTRIAFLYTGAALRP